MNTSRFASVPRALLLASISLALASASSAGTLYVRAGAPPGGDGRSWASALPDLSSALAQAVPGEDVWIAAGRYLPSAFLDPTDSFVLPDGVSLLGGFAGNETSPAQRDIASHETILDGDLLGDDGPGFTNYDDNSIQVVTAVGLASVELDGLTVRGGSEGSGGGLSLVADDVHLSRLTLRENRATTGEGAGAFVRATMTRIEDCVFRDNKATAAGGIQLRGGLVAARAELERCTFERNHATGGAGIAVAARQIPIEVLLSECTFRDQQGTGGGGVVFSSEVSSELVVERCTFERLQATSGAGISVNSEEGCDVQVRQSVFRDCTASAGAGLSVSTEQTSSVVVSDCLFERTRVCSGAIFLYGASGIISRCRVFAEPMACGLGAGGDAVRVILPTDGADIRDCLFVGASRQLVKSNGTLRVDGCTLVTLGGTFPALVCTGSATVVNSILWGNPAQQLAFPPSTQLLVAHSDVHMNGVTLPGTANLDVDPLFADPAAGNYGLRATSPCIDTGDPALVRVGADVGNDSRLLDGNLDGRVRIDMGADEYAPVRLRVLGTPAVGNTLNLITTGAAGLTTRMLIGTPGLRQLPAFGSLFISPTGLQVFPWPATPSNVAGVVPPGIVGLTLHVQALCFGGGARVVSNYVELQF